MLSRFSKPKQSNNFHKALGLLVLVFGVTGCTAVSLIDLPIKQEKKFKTTPLPYKFSITSFADNRPEPTSLSQDIAFNQPAFLSEFSKSLGYQLFGSSTARIKISLEEYNFSHFKRNFTMSMALNIKAKNNIGKMLVDQGFTCAVDHYSSVKDIANMAMALPKNLEIVTKDGWMEKIELDLLKKCVQSVINDFSKAVVRGTPAQGEF